MAAHGRQSPRQGLTGRIPGARHRRWQGPGAGFFRAGRLATAPARAFPFLTVAMPTAEGSAERVSEQLPESGAQWAPSPVEPGVGLKH